MSVESANSVAEGTRNSRLIKNTGAFLKSIFLMVTFLVVLVLMFSPILEGENALKAADRLFNSISKGSTNYIPGMLKQARSFTGTTFTAKLQFATPEIAQQASKILGKAGALTGGSEKVFTVSGDLGTVLTVALNDSGAMFANRDKDLTEKYGLSGKQSLYVWWTLLKEMDRDLTRQKNFKEAAFVSTVVKKGVEVGYNFFGIEPETAAKKALPLSLSLVFYVTYTLWWGVAIMWLFNGLGLEMKAGAKKEV
jgi:hypothetical protein